MENEILKYLEVFQICDSTFPIGTFNHSFGMENYLHDWRIRKAPEFNIWITNYYRSQFKYGEGLLTRICYEAIENDDFEKIIEYDNSLTKATLALETREGTKMITHQMIGLINRIYGNSINLLNRYERAIDDGKAYGNPAIVFTIFAHYKGMKQRDLTLMYGYSVASTLVQNAVRAIPLGQKEGQVILNGLIFLLDKVCAEISELDEEFLGANAPGLELAQIKHETQTSRLFMS